MSVYDDFFSKYQKVIDRQDVPLEAMKKYEFILPEAIINVWKKHGWGGYEDGLFWTIDPDKYLEYIQKWVVLDCKDIYPIMRTAFGDLIILYNLKKGDDECEDVLTAVIDVKHHDAADITVGLEYFFKGFLLSPGSLMAKTKIKSQIFFDATDNIGILKFDQCYGYEPILPLGGKEDFKNLRIVNFDVHLDILTQALKKPVEL